MTETVVNEEQATEEKPVPAVEQFGDFATMAMDRAKDVIAELQSTAAKLQAGSNIGELISEAIKSSQDAEVVKRREMIQKANEKILEWTKENEEAVKPTLSVPSEDEVKALDASYKEGVSKFKTLDTIFVNEVKASYPELSLTDYLGELPKGRRGATGAKAGQGEGSSRPRVSKIEVSTDNGETYSVVEKDGKSTFSVFTQWLKKETGETVGATDLHEAWFDAYKIKEWTDAPEVSEFNYSLNSKDYFIRVTK